MIQIKIEIEGLDKTAVSIGTAILQLIQTMGQGLESQVVSLDEDLSADDVHVPVQPKRKRRTKAEIEAETASVNGHKGSGVDLAMAEDEADAAGDVDEFGLGIPVTKPSASAGVDLGLDDLGLDDATEPTPAPAPAKAAAKAAPKKETKPKTNINEVIGEAQRLVRGKKQDELRTILGQIGVQRPKDLKPEQYDQFIQLASQIA